jgi:hypothetical protein
VLSDRRPSRAWVNFNQKEYDVGKKPQSTFERLQGLNRRERRSLRRRLFSGDPGLTIVNPKATGIDVGNQSHYVVVPVGRTRVRCRSSVAGRRI